MNTIWLTPEQEKWFVNQLATIGLPREGSYFFDGPKESLGCPNCRSSTACKIEYNLNKKLVVECWACGKFLVGNDIVNGGDAKSCPRCSAKEHYLPGPWCVLRDVLENFSQTYREAGETVDQCSYWAPDCNWLNKVDYDELKAFLERLEAKTR